MKWARLVLGTPEKVLKTGTHAGPGPRLNSVWQPFLPGHKATIVQLHPQTPPIKLGDAMSAINEFCPSKRDGGRFSFY